MALFGCVMFFEQSNTSTEYDIVFNIEIKLPVTVMATVI